MSHLSQRSIVWMLVFLFVASTAFAYVLLSPTRSWPSPPNFIVDDMGHPTIADADGGASATRDAITSAAAWNGAGAGVVIRARVGSVAGGTPGDGIPMIFFTDPFGICTGSCVAASLTGFYSGSTIYDSDIIVGSALSFTSEGEDPGGVGCSGEVYIEGLMVHETGHALGLAHTSVTGATMYPSVSFCNNAKATIEPDDMSGILALYGLPGTCSGSCGGLSPDGCYCDSLCHTYGDCCQDKISICGYP